MDSGHRGGSWILKLGEELLGDGGGGGRGGGSE